MGLRQTMNENPVVTSVIVGVITLGALFYVGKSACGGGGAPLAEGPAKAFYTVDDGKTWFPDDANKIPPFDKDGKKAYRVAVYKCADGKEFVNHIEGYPENMRAEIERAGGPGGTMVGAMSKEVKRPGDKTWVSMKDPAKFSKISGPKCPDGSSAATPVEPQ